MARRSSVRNLVLENLFVNNDGNEMDEQYLGRLSKVASEKFFVVDLVALKWTYCTVG